MHWNNIEASEWSLTLPNLLVTCYSVLHCCKKCLKLSIYKKKVVFVCLFAFRGIEVLNQDLLAPLIWISHKAEHFGREE